MVRLPAPSAYLDPLYGLETCFYYAIPKYYPSDHPNTRWLVSMIRNRDADRIRRKMELQPEVFKTSYFQLLDYPAMYDSSDPTANSLFHKQAIVYLTVLGIAYYFKSVDVVKMVLDYRDPIGDKLYTLKEPQYATHVQDTVTGDFHAFPLSVIMLRSGCYDYVPDLIANKWNPLEPICMPARRRYERRAYYFIDWLEYCLWLMQERPLLPLARLVQNMTLDLALYKFQLLPMSVVNPKSGEERVPTGLIEVDNLPYDARMVGTRSLLEMAEDYASYQQTKERYEEVRNCIRQMIADGYNPQIVMAQAHDYDPGYETENTETGANANNNAAAAKKGKTTLKAQGPYASEATRVLLHALRTGAKVANKTPLHLLLDAVDVYIKRGLFLIEQPPNKRKGKSQKLPQDVAEANKLLMEMQKRDARNAVVLLLNLLQQQFDKIDKLNKQQKWNINQKHKHIDPTRQVINKRLSLAKNLKRLVGVLFHILMHSGQLLRFVEANFPPYNIAKNEIDFQLNPSLQNTFIDMQMRVILELNQSTKAPSYMTIREMKKIADIKTIFLNLRLGRTPDIDPRVLRKLNKNRDGRGKAKNTSNKNVSSDANQQQQLSQLVSVPESPYLFSNDLGSPQLCETAKHGHISFVRIKRRRKSPTKESDEEKEEKVPQEQDSIKEDAAPQTEDNLELEAEESPNKAVEEDEPNPTAAVNEDVAETLANQIAQLRRRSLQEGNAADAALAEIYSRILEDLKTRAAAAEATAANVVATATTETAYETIEDTEREEVPESSRVITLQQQQQQQQQHEQETVTRATSRSINQCRPGKTGRRIGKRRLSKVQNLGCSVRRPKCYQMVRVFDTPQEGTEFM